MSDSTESSRLAPHPVAALLTPEMKARVRAARFYRDSDPDREFCATVAAEVDGVICCPMGVAIGSARNAWDAHPIPDTVMEALEIEDANAMQVIEHFIHLIDQDGVTDPADVYALLDCLPIDAARPPAAPEVAP